MVTRLFSRVGLPIAALALTALAACEEPEQILPGEREDIRPASDLETVAKSGSQPISLPSQSANASWPQSPGTAQPSGRQMLLCVRHPNVFGRPRLGMEIPANNELRLTRLSRGGWSTRLTRGRRFQR